MSSAESIVVCSSLMKVYEAAAGRVQAVRGIDLAFESGTTSGVVGPSGSGKSSLLRMLAGLDQPTAGSVTIRGKDLSGLRPGQRARMRATVVTHVYQRPGDNLLSHLTARQQLTRLAPRVALVAEALQAVGLEHRADHQPHQLSGGEQQRLAFARALVCEAPVVIADEPTATLDTASADRVLDAMDELKARGAAVIVATHDERVLPRLDRIIMLRDGAVASITAGGTEAAVIDRSGRIQLPPRMRERFPDDRVVLGWDDESGEMTARPT